MSNNYPISYVIGDLENLFSEHKRCVHSLMLNESYSPFSPTYFMYSFCFFYTLYNIDWEKSLKSGFETMSEIPFEKEKQMALINFCFSDDSFCANYSHEFCDSISGSYELKEFFDNLDQIKRDENPKGNFFEDKIQADIDTFINDIEELLCNYSFKPKRIKRIVNFIYKVRCNIFHGVKCFSLMNEGSQKYRLKVYGDIIMALCNMTLRYAKEVKNKENEDK